MQDKFDFRRILDLGAYTKTRYSFKKTVSGSDIFKISRSDPDTRIRSPA